MSNDKRRRGLVRTQHTSAILNISSPAWEEAVAAFEAAQRAHEEACAASKHGAANPEDTLAAYYAARDRLFGTPATSGAQLAYKIASHDDAPDFRHPDVIQATAAGDDDNEKAWLALYLDALALSGVRAPITPPAVLPGYISSELRQLAAEFRAAFAVYARAVDAQDVPDPAPELIEDLEITEGAVTALYERLLAYEPVSLAELSEKWALIRMDRRNTAGEWDVLSADIERLVREPAPQYLDWQGIAEKAAEVTETFGGMIAGPEGRAGWEVSLATLAEHAAALATNPEEAKNPVRVAAAATVAERFARELAEHSDGYRNWAVNPDGLRELVEAVTLIQGSARELASAASPSVAGVAIDLAFFSDDETPPPQGPGGGVRLAPANDRDAAEYASAKARLNELAKMPSPPEAEQSATFQRWDAAADRLLTTKPASIEGIAARLRAIVEAGSDIDLSENPERFAEIIASAPDARALRGPHGCGTEDADAVLAAVAFLYQGVVEMAGPPSGAGEWFEARAAFERLERERDALFSEDEAEIPRRKPGVTEAEDTANLSAFIDAQYRVLQTPAPSIAEAAWKFGLLFSAFLGGGADPREPGGLGWLDAGSPSDAFAASLYRDLIRLGAETDAAALAAWDRAVSTFSAAVAEEERLCRIDDEARAAVDAEAPVPELLKSATGAHYLSEALISEAPLPMQDAMRTALRQWKADVAAAEARHDAEAKSKAWEEFDTHTPWLALMDTPAPTASALAFKLGAYLRHVHLQRAYQDPDTAAFISELLADCAHDGAAPVARIYQDALRLAGERPDLAAAEPFDAAEWLERFEELPGHTVDEDGPRFEEGVALSAEDAQSPAGLALWRSLDPSHQRAVIHEARRRDRAAKRIERFGPLNIVTGDDQ